MSPAKREPPKLRRGKLYHKQIQNDWGLTAEGIVKKEKVVLKRSRRKGRIDIHVVAAADLVAVVEIKRSNWDRMTLVSVKRTAAKYARQVEEYINAECRKNRDVSPGIIFPRRPKDIKRLALIEKMFEERGIPCVWQDETKAQRKKRN